MPGGRKSLLHDAAVRGVLQMVMIFLEHGADLDLREEHEEIPLHWGGGGVGWTFVSCW